MVAPVPGPDFIARLLRLAVKLFKIIFVHACRLQVLVVFEAAVKEIVLVFEELMAFYSSFSRWVHHGRSARYGPGSGRHLARIQKPCIVRKVFCPVKSTGYKTGPAGMHQCFLVSRVYGDGLFEVF